jgi:hypothetical protein
MLEIILGIIARIFIHLIAEYLADIIELTVVVLVSRFMMHLSIARRLVRRIRRWFFYDT